MLMNIEYYTIELQEATGEERTAAAGQVDESRERLKNLARRLSKITRHLGEENREFVNLSGAVKDAMDFAGRHRSLRSVRVDFEGAGEIMFMGNLLLIYQVIHNSDQKISFIP